MRSLLKVGFKLADAGGLGARSFGAGLQFSTEAVAFRGQTGDGLVTLSGERFKAGAGGGLRIGLRQLLLQSCKRIEGLAVALIK